MHVPSIEVHKAATLEEAGALLGRFAPDVRLAGGTDVLVDLKSARYTVSHLIALGAIKGLRGVTQRSDGLRIGALTTLTELDRSPLIAGAYAALRDATSEMATPQVRNAATVGGNVAGAVPCADLPPILIATLYKIPNYRYDGYRVMTNKPECGAMRGHGVPQPRFAFECLLSMAADDLAAEGSSRERATASTAARCRFRTRSRASISRRSRSSHVRTRWCGCSRTARPQC